MNRDEKFRFFLLLRRIQALPNEVQILKKRQIFPTHKQINFTNSNIVLLVHVLIIPYSEKELNIKAITISIVDVKHVFLFFLV